MGEQGTAVREEGLGAGATALVVAGVVATLALLAVPGFVLAWFAPAFGSGATCSVGVQPFCTPGYGMPQLYALLAACVLAAVVLAVGIAAALRGRRRRALVLTGCAVALGALALALVGANAWIPGLPADWTIA